MFLVDSCGWIELLEDGPLYSKFLPYLGDREKIVTPAIVVYEVYKKIRQTNEEHWALLAISQMQKTIIVPLDERTALKAADISLSHDLPMADAIILATGYLMNAQVVTSDSHFKGLDGVIFIE